MGAFTALRGSTKHFHPRHHHTNHNHKITRNMAALTLSDKIDSLRGEFEAFMSGVDALPRQHNLQHRHDLIGLLETGDSVLKILRPFSTASKKDDSDEESEDEDDENTFTPRVSKKQKKPEPDELDDPKRMGRLGGVGTQYLHEIKPEVVSVGRRPSVDADSYC